MRRNASVLLEEATSMADKGFRITYATMSADNEQLHADYEKGVEVSRGWLGQQHPFYVSGEARTGSGHREERSPIDKDVLIGEFAQATREDVRDAVAAAKAYASTWMNTPWQERVALVERAADLISERRNELAALMAIEVGKNRLEALGDVEESADLLRWNCNEMKHHDGFQTSMQAMGSPGEYYDVLRPYGVWVVISPFNFPMALAAGPSSGALVAGNCVVFKPSHTGVFTGLKLFEVYRDAGIPPAVFQIITGAGSVAGDELVHHPDVDGITFTGSYEVGMGIYKSFATDFPKPVICEMGGKNPTIVTGNADLDKATEGGDPLQKENWLGPIIDEKAMETFEEAAAEAKKNGNVITGGERLSDGEYAKGNFVQPTVVEVPLDSWIWKKELFVPFLSVAPYDDLDEAIRLANDTEYGLTAGFYSEDRGEIDRWLNSIEAGVVYVNRRAGATTGAWPGVQPFGGWKGSGTSGKAGGGPYYVQQYLREQSRTIIEE